MNFSRVFGPILGGAVEALGGASLVFAVNGLTYLFVVVALCSVKADFSPPRRQPSLRGARSVRASPRSTPTG